MKLLSITMLMLITVTLLKADIQPVIHRSPDKATLEFPSKINRDAPTGDVAGG